MVQWSKPENYHCHNTVKWAKDYLDLTNFSYSCPSSGSESSPGPHTVPWFVMSPEIWDTSSVFPCPTLPWHFQGRAVVSYFVKCLHFRVIWWLRAGRDFTLERTAWRKWDFWWAWRKGATWQKNGKRTFHARRMVCKHTCPGALWCYLGSSLHVQVNGEP